MQTWDVLYPDPSLACMEGVKAVTLCCQLPSEEILCLLASAHISSVVIKIMAMQRRYRSEWIPLWLPCQHWQGKQ